MSDTLHVLPQKYSDTLTPLFSSEDDYYKSRDEFLSSLQPELDELNEKRRKSEEAAQTRRYR